MPAKFTGGLAIDRSSGGACHANGGGGGGGYQALTHSALRMASASLLRLVLVKEVPELAFCERHGYNFIEQQNCIEQRIAFNRSDN